MKTLSIVIMALMLFSIFAVGFVIAENEEVTSVSDIAGENAEGDVNSVLNESSAIDDDVKIVGLNAVTLADGWVIASDNTKAEIVRALWTTKKQLKVDAVKVKEIRDKYKGDKAKIVEELKKMTSDVVVVSQGRLNIGTGKNMEKFKLVKKEITEQKAIFYVLSINSKLTETEASTNAIGSLELVKKQYPNMALWTGKLTLDSQAKAIVNKDYSSNTQYHGIWNVNLASKTKLFKGAGKEVKEARENLKEAKEKISEAKEELKDKVKEAKKPLWKFWQKKDVVQAEQKCEKVCKAIGTRSEGLYDSCTGKLVEWADCG